MICPVCKSPDETSYLRCHRPDCTDGRHLREEFHAAYPEVKRHWDNVEKGVREGYTPEDAERLATGSPPGIDLGGLRFLKMLGLAVTFIALLIVLMACTRTGVYTPCETCIGPYDIRLSSHREALFGRH